MDFSDVYPNPFDINETLRKARFFLGDKWIDVGDIVMSRDKNNLFIDLPDIEQFLAGREYLDDGTLDWAARGVRLN